MKKRVFVLITTCCLVVSFLFIKLYRKGDHQMYKYNFPHEESKHEGTWLIWPHHYTYGKTYREEIESIWVEMVEGLHSGENVHIIAYNETEKQRIIKLLEINKIDMSKIDFIIKKSNDVWIRDTGPMFVYDEKSKVCIADFKFDGWGKKVPYKYDDSIPEEVANKKGFPLLSIPDFVLEGGSIEMDGNGIAMLCKSSVVSENRNDGMSIEEAEEYLKYYFGISQFIWLNGVMGEDITDAHIDGIARFYDGNTLLTVSKQDFLELYEGIEIEDYDRLINAKNIQGKGYQVKILPLTKKNVKGLDYKGNYLNYYVANNVVLLPVYGDENDKIALEIISNLYSSKKIIPINVTNLYKYGGMIHCITQQQPK